MQTRFIEHRLLAGTIRALMRPQVTLYLVVIYIEACCTAVTRHRPRARVRRCGRALLVVLFKPSVSHAGRDTSTC